MILKWRLLILLVVLVVVYCFKSSQLIINPPRFVSPYTPADFGLDYKPLKLITEDNLTIDAWFVPADSNSAPTIITCHGFNADKGDCINMARFLQPAGYNVLMFDFRGHGKSEGKYCSLGYHGYKHLSAAISYLSEQKLTPIGAIGFSMGGTVALFAQAKNKKLTAVVSDGAYLSFSSAVISFARRHYKVPKYPFIPPAIWTAALRLKFNPNRLNLVGLMPQISPRHCFIIHGALDPEISPRDAHTLFDNAKEPKKLWIVEGARHCNSYDTAREEYEYQVIAFFNSYLKEKL